ncbi:nuclear polyadenylated RNA-binding protein 4 [Scheffersomyces xylosifermentans]|uniref:nuclear polyadenylated RNA-binding protein 4 n=1 Tax=Scheffersomyces xylosifermentans TaxID=1304137 RepID=UPI00315D7446
MSSYDDDEALFEDIYDDDANDVKTSGEDTSKTTAEASKDSAASEQKPEASSASETTTSKPESTESAPQLQQDQQASSGDSQPPVQSGDQSQLGQVPSQSTEQNQQQQQQQPTGQFQQFPPFPMPGQGLESGGQFPPPPPPPQQSQQSHQPSNMGRENGKMFIGGLNWDTTEEGLVQYFSKFGEVVDYTIMKDNNTGKSRGFGFLTFRDPKSVDEVIKTDHILDGKLIDPKRAIAREEQDKVGKIFVGGIDPMVNERDFHEFFSQFGSIIDAQLMIDKDTGRSRGFGFITYDSPEAVDRVTVNKFLTLKGKAMEVKRAEPRGQHQQNQLQQQQQQQQQSYYNNNYGGGQYGNQQYPQGMGGYGQQMTPEMMEYWQRMQQWFMFQQQQQAAQAGGQVGGDQGQKQDSSDQPDQPLNPQQQANEPEPESDPNSSDNRNNNENQGGDNGGYQGGYDNRDQRRLNLPKGPRRAPPSGPSGNRGRGGYHKRSRGYHPYNRGGRYNRG